MDQVADQQGCQYKHGHADHSVQNRPGLGAGEPRCQTTGTETEQAEPANAGRAGAEHEPGAHWRRLLGANAAGPYGSGAVLRMDMLAIAIHAGMSTDELGMVDLAYAPPFSGVWDAVHIAANAAK